MTAQHALPTHREAWFGRRTDDHFARLINDPGELDAPVKTALLGALQPGETFLLIIQAPYQGVLAVLEHKPRRGKQLPWEFTPDWVLALTGARLLLVRLGEAGNPPEIISIPLGAILSLQNGTVLLRSWFEVGWAQNARASRQKIFYNAVCEPFFIRLTALLRASWAAGPQSQGEPGSLEQLPFKFKNLLPLRVFLPGEQAHRILYRPAVWQTRFGLFRRMLAARMVLALTGSCLALAEEDLSGREGSYGFIVTWLPRTALRNIAWSPEETMSISLACAGTVLNLSMIFPQPSSDQMEEWQQLFPAQ